MQVHELLQTIAQAATDSIGARLPHEFYIGGFENGEPFAAWVSNIEKSWRASPTFRWSATAVRAPLCMAAGSGRFAVSREDQEKMARASHAQARPHDLQRLLAFVNRRTALRAAQVSADCLSVYVAPDGSRSLRTFAWKADSRLMSRVFELPGIWRGLDTSDPFSMFTSLFEMLAVKEAPWLGEGQVWGNWAGLRSGIFLNTEPAEESDGEPSNSVDST
jgi:hypothetical protein